MSQPKTLGNPLCIQNGNIVPIGTTYLLFLYQLSQFIRTINHFLNQFFYIIPMHYIYLVLKDLKSSFHIFWLYSLKKKINFFIKIRQKTFKKTDLKYYDMDLFLCFFALCDTIVVVVDTV